MKRFRVRIWDDIADSSPNEDEYVDAHTHLQALEIVFHRLRYSSAEWVQVDEPQGRIRQFLDVFVSCGVLDYATSYNYAVE